MSTDTNIHLERGEAQTIQSVVRTDESWNFETLELSYRVKGDAQSRVLFFLPKPADDILEAIVKGIFESRPELRDRILAKALWEKQGIDPEYEAAQADRPTFGVIDETYADRQEAKRGERMVTNYCCEHDDHRGHCALHPEGI